MKLIQNWLFATSFYSAPNLKNSIHFWRSSFDQNSNFHSLKRLKSKFGQFWRHEIPEKSYILLVKFGQNSNFNNFQGIILTKIQILASQNWPKSKYGQLLVWFWFGQTWNYDELYNILRLIFEKPILQPVWFFIVQSLVSQF